MAYARAFTHAVLLLWVSATLSVAQQQPTTSASKPEDRKPEDRKPEDQVAQLERDWLTADGKGDLVSLRRIIADDFIGSSFDGSLLSKDDIIPQTGGPGGFAGATPGETIVRVFGDTAVLMGVIIPGGPQPKEIRATLVCQKRSQGWQMIAARLTD
jgi:ketosteroid isomerase-like protein